MEELKLLVDTVAGLPTLTVWVLAGYLLYKLAVIGSVYGLFRFGIEKLHDYLRNRYEVKDMRPIIGHHTISGSAAHLESILIDLRGIADNTEQGHRRKSGYIWPDDVSWLREAVNEKRERDKNAVR